MWEHAFHKRNWCEEVVYINFVIFLSKIFVILKTTWSPKPKYFGASSVFCSYPSMSTIDQTLCPLFMGFMGLYYFKELLLLKRIMVKSILTWRETLYNFIQLSFKEIINGRSLYSLSLFFCSIALLSFTWMFDNICKNLKSAARHYVWYKRNHQFRLPYPIKMMELRDTSSPYLFQKNHTTLVLSTR